MQRPRIFGKKLAGKSTEQAPALSGKESTNVDTEQKYTFTGFKQLSETNQANIDDIDWLTQNGKDDNDPTYQHIIVPGKSRHHEDDYSIVVWLTSWKNSNMAELSLREVPNHALSQQYQPNDLQDLQIIYRPIRPIKIIQSSQVEDGFYIDPMYTDYNDPLDPNNPEHQERLKAKFNSFNNNINLLKNVLKIATKAARDPELNPHLKHLFSESNLGELAVGYSATE